MAATTVADTMERDAPSVPLETGVEDVVTRADLLAAIDAAEV